MLGPLLQAVLGLFFRRRNEYKILFGNSQKCLRQCSEWNFWRAINAQCAARVCTGVCTVISRLFPRSVDIVAWPVKRRFAIAFCTSWKISEVIQRSTSTRLAFPATKNNSVEIAQNPDLRSIIPSINPPRKLMEEYRFLAHNNLRVARAKQLGRSMKKTTSCNALVICFPRPPTPATCGDFVGQ